MPTNPLSTNSPSFGRFATIHDFAEYLNNGFVANHYRWFWFVLNTASGPKIQKFDTNRIGSIGYVREKPERARSYISKVVEGDADLIEAIFAVASGKPRPALIRFDK